MPRPRKTKVARKSPTPKPIYDMPAESTVTTFDTPNPTASIPVEPVMQVRERKIERIRRDYVDMKTPDRVPYLVRDRDKDIQRWQRKGYTAVRANEVAEHDGTVDAEGFIHFDDRIAMACPRALKDERDAKKIADHRAREGRLSDAAEAEARASGGSIYTDVDSRTQGRSFNIPVEFRD